MDVLRSAASGRRVVNALSGRLVNAAALLLLALAGLGWSSQSQAQTCDFVQLGATSAINLSGSSVSFSLEAQTACSPTVNVAIAITADTTGGATVQAPANPTVLLDTPYVFSVNLGPTPGGIGTVTATCLSGGCAGDVLTYTFRTNNQFSYTAATPTLVTNQITPVTLTTNFLLNGAPGALATSFFNLTTNSAIGVPVNPNAGGSASTVFSTSIVNTYAISGSLNCPVLAALEGCPPPPVNFSVQVEAVTLAATTPIAPSTTAGTPLSLRVRYGSASIPAPNGTNMSWTVASQPPGGDAVLNGNPVAAAGVSTAIFSATVPGTYTVFANSGCTFCAPGSQTFTVTVNAFPYVLVPVSPNPLAGSSGVGLPVTVRLEQGGAPVAGATVLWNASAPFSPASATSITNAAAGEASATFTPSTFGSFTNAIVASVDIDGIPASGDEASLSFDANIAFVASLAIAGGNSQSALVNTAFANPLQVNAQNSGLPGAGITINWAVTAGSAVLSAATSVTDAAGNTAITATAGATAGPVTITGTRQDDPSATVSFSLAVDGLGTLAIIDGDGQLLAAGAASAPMQVELTNAAGAPVAGAVVAWTTSSGTLASATSTTNAAGRASNTVTITAAGAVQVTASSPLAAAPAEFGLNGALASLADLSETQSEVAKAIDSACPALAGLASPTPGQQDLLQRCQELIGAAGLDPNATIVALDQLMADVALTQVNAAFSAAQSQFINLKTRIAALRSGAGGTDFGGLAINTSMGPLSLGMLGSAFSNSAAETGAEIGTDFSRWGFFAAGTIGRGEADGGAVNPAYDFDVEGVTAGVDYRKSDQWIIGGSLGYTRQDTQLPGNRGGLDTNGWSVSAYTTYYQADSWYMDGVLTYGQNDYELLRQISYTLPLPGGGSTSINQVAQADSGGDLLSTAFTVGRDFNRGAFGIGPYARVLYTRLGFDDISEQLLPGLAGSGLGLRIDNRDVTSLASVLGAKFTYTHSAGWGVLMPHLQLEWEHEFEDDPQAIEARFINDPTGSAMLLSGDRLDTDYFRLGLGLSMVLTRGRSGFMYYERLAGMNGMSQYNLALGFRMEF
ncbi:MAG: autotransporter domain-containing protein [Arenimonas sp.]|uniref:autotransporter outer membrane beta-barrel domain-containing protein n=1 Tax=Arenimonas sp. TaxID=1872635 RepID=UPI0025C2B7AA|nr:autotransporter outer membrane beta-barrel domain-containing protein [Arenimonas sp.]MBW8367493.1 autotransporter domain-containing protein [Arenimonas sp.]